jgi:hypothetical protein
VLPAVAESHHCCHALRPTGLSTFAIARFKD